MIQDVMRAAMDCWRLTGQSLSVISGPLGVVRSAVGWAHVERIIESNALSVMR